MRLDILQRPAAPASAPTPGAPGHGTAVPDRAERWPRARWRLLALALFTLALVTLARLVIAWWLPLSEDEAYYWVWSRALAPGFLDHPPMVALWIAAGCWVAGHGALGVRLLAPLAAAAGSILLAATARDLRGRPGAGIAAAVMLNATLLLGIGSVTMTPDTPLLLFWTATLWALGRLAATGEARWWLIAGAFAGLALDSKYTAILIAPSVLGWVLCCLSLRRWLRRWEFWGSGAVALAVFSPVVAWNATHGWASFARQGGRAADWAPERAAQFAGELVGGQFGLATPLLAVLFAAGIVWAVRRAWRGEAAGGLLAWTSLLPALVFAQHALGDRVQGNWPSICYPAAAIAAAGLPGSWRSWWRPSAAVGAAMTVLVWMQGTLAPVPLPADLDPTLMRLGGWPELAADVAAAARRTGAAYVAADGYGIASKLARELPSSLPVLGVDPRWRYFDLPRATAALRRRPGLLIRAAHREDKLSPRDWAAAAPGGELTRARDGVTAEAYRLYRVTVAAKASAALLPRPR